MRNICTLIVYWNSKENASIFSGCYSIIHRTIYHPMSDIKINKNYLHVMVASDQWTESNPKRQVYKVHVTRITLYKIFAGYLHPPLQSVQKLGHQHLAFYTILRYNFVPKDLVKYVVPILCVVPSMPCVVLFFVLLVLHSVLSEPLTPTMKSPTRFAFLDHLSSPNQHSKASIRQATIALSTV